MISIHLILGDTTRGIVGERELSWMKRSAFLVNTSRGQLVDEQALSDALREERIAGAGLDVFGQESISDGHSLLQVRNTVLTPHIG